MPRPANLLRRAGGTYYARIHVPKDLVQDMDGRTDKWVSLKTKDFEEAKRRLIGVLDEWTGVFADLRRRRELTEVDLALAVHEHYTSKLREGDLERATRATQLDVDAAFDKVVDRVMREGLDLDAIGAVNANIEVEILANRADWAADRRRRRLARLRKDLGLGDTALAEPDADEFLAKKHLRIAKGTLQYRELCLRLMRADIQHLEIYAQRDRGEFGGQPSDPIIAQAAAIAEAEETVRSAGGPQTLSDLFTKYERENPNEVRPESLAQARRDVRHFTEFVGVAMRPDRISRAMVRDWKALLAEYPVKASETGIFKGMTSREIVAKNKLLSSPKPTLTRQTVRRYLANLGGFCRWLVKNDYLDANPVADMLPKKAGPTNKRSSFEDEALEKLFGSPLFTGAAGKEWRDISSRGDVAIRDHRFWIPWVMLYSGARSAEVAQLLSSDLREQEGIWVMHISDEGPGEKRTKTAGSKRIVPVHSELVELGFIDHVLRQRITDEARVFPEVEIPKEGQIAAQFSREFNRYLGKIGVKVGPEIVTYSLRHTFVDRARQAGFMDNEIAIVVGHETGVSKKTVTSGYGNEQHGTLERRRQIVEAVRFPFLARLLEAS